MRFSGRRSDGVKAGTSARVGGVVCVLIAAFFGVLAGLQCDTGRVVGLGGGYEQPSCSLDCGCKPETSGFSPVCILNTSTTYFSPCHAGCREYEDLNGMMLLSDCSCGPGRAVRGSCALPSCWFIYNLYLVFFTLVLATSAASFLMQGMAVLRSVPRRDKPIAIGVSFAFVGLFSHGVGHLLYMGIGYLNCGYQVGSSCLLHDFTMWSVAACSCALAALSGAVSLLASRASRAK